MTLVDNLVRGATDYPMRAAYIYNGNETTYEELYEHVRDTASYLAQTGIGPGDHVALLLGNSPEFVIAYYGILLSGAAVVPINPLYTPHEMLFILRDSGVRMAIAASVLLPAFEGVRSQLPELEMVVLVGVDECSVPWAVPFPKMMAHTNPEWTPPVVDGGDRAVILYTSGTTGTPKGAILTHRNMASNADSISEYLGVYTKDKFVAVLPMFHVFCMTVCLNAPIANGATILIAPRFSPKPLIELIEEQQATIFAGVPTMYNFMMQQSDVSASALSSLRICVSGGAAMPVALLHGFEKRFNKVISEGYGLSEAAPVTAFNPVEGVRKPGSVGVDIPGVTNKVVDAEGGELARGEVGELIVQGPNVMEGYLNLPEETALALRNGWLYTGDMAYMDEDGYVFIVDRKKDMILVGGYNVYPREVEEVLYTHPLVMEAAVIGVPDERFGERIQAYVVRKDESLTEDELREHCSRDLARYKVPRDIIFMEELPKNTTGKILRRSLKDQIVK
ncbi:long-chain acyl-CoA synthetase [Aneurinibacillus soli]|uniref:Long-chain-fatty-acid--CoA ligase n=1 Tax=Aneurinibacillus soli TaxID=1500254 RepID=A0A0U5BIE6_9BACL|nr:long-chain acyl-CoA synthetase [Aneurinibacillus soli]BAU27934.1 Long-chain-fatty-acid--CoA ligase [Aneurinibacillus soli]